MWQVRFERGREKGNVGCFFTVGDENVVSFGIDLLVSSLWMFCRRNQIWGGGISSVAVVPGKRNVDPL